MERIKLLSNYYIEQATISVQVPTALLWQLILWLCEVFCVTIPIQSYCGITHCMVLLHVVLLVSLCTLQQSFRCDSKFACASGTVRFQWWISSFVVLAFVLACGKTIWDENMELTMAFHGWKLVGCWLKAVSSTYMHYLYRLRVLMDACLGQYRNCWWRICRL